MSMSKIIVIDSPATSAFVRCSADRSCYCKRHIAWILLVPPAVTQGLFVRGHVTFLSPPKILAVAPRVLL
ncbi:hypothetical protein YC2023_114395 [Brassica napus]